MDREDAIYQNNFREPDLSGLALLCANVANNRSAHRKQSDAAHALRVEWVRMQLDRSPHDDKVEAEEESLKKRMAEFLAGVPREGKCLILRFLGALRPARERGDTGCWSL